MARIIIATSAGETVLTIIEPDPVMRDNQKRALYRAINRAVAIARIKDD